MSTVSAMKRGNKWQYRFEAAQIEGKRNWITKSGYRTKKDALDAGNKAYNEYINTGHVFTATMISVSDFMDLWLKDYAKPNLADATVQAYENIVRNHIKPAIGKYHLKTISTLELQEMVNDIVCDNDYSSAFVKNIVKVLKGSFTYAKKMHLIKYNPTDDIMLPHMEDKERVHVHTTEEMNRILDRFRDSPYQYYALLIAYFTGLRVSEVYGLTWDDIDLEARTITVEKIVKRCRSGLTGGSPRGIRGQAHTTWFYGDTKTPSSNRTIRIGDTLASGLQSYLEWQKKNEEFYGIYYVRHYGIDEKSASNRSLVRIVSQVAELPVPEGYRRLYPVLIKENGEFHGTDAMKYPSKVINDELGIDFRFHDLRHTHATILVESNAPIKGVQARLGHSDIKTTMNIYVDSTEEMESATVDIFEKSAEGLKLDSSDSPRLHVIWSSMKNRCNSNSYYVRNGITVCPEWKNYDNFRDWAMLNGYQDGLCLERIDKNGPYTEDNCCWSTLHEVKKNKKKDSEKRVQDRCTHFVHIG